MKHKESDLQIRCVKWFRYQYPAFARLMEHPHNEGNAFNRRQQAIANAEGVTKGVADLILHVPSYKQDADTITIFTSLALEMKTKEGRQSDSQKQWQRLFEAAGGRYLIVRSYDEFAIEVTRYMMNVPLSIANEINKVFSDIRNEEDEKARQQMRRFLNQQ